MYAARQLSPSEGRSQGGPRQFFHACEASRSNDPPSRTTLIPIVLSVLAALDSTDSPS
jgi:hypothetical protein